MPCRLECDACEFERTLKTWPDANQAASAHEADYVDHWVTILELQPA